MIQKFATKTSVYNRWYVWLAVFIVFYGLVRYIEDHETPGSGQQSHSASGRNNAKDPRKSSLNPQERVIVDAIRNTLTNDLSILASAAYQYRLRPTSMGGGQGSYLGFVIPKKMKANENATYEAQVFSPNLVTLTAVSARNQSDVIVVHVDDSGNLSDWTYGGDFGDL